MDDKIRSVLTHKISVKKITFTVMDILLFLVLTGFALIMRYALRNVVAGDYKMFFEQKRPVISPLNAKSALQVGDEREKNETSGESVD